MKRKSILSPVHSLHKEAHAGNSDVITHLPSSRDLHLLRGIRLPEVLHLTGLSRSTWYARLNPSDPSYDPAAPKPFKVGNSRHSPSIWWAWQVIAYLEAKSFTRAEA